MVTTNVIDVSLDGSIYELKLMVHGVMEVRLKRHAPDEAFRISDFSVFTDDENVLDRAMNVINGVLSEHNITELVVQSTSSELMTLRI